MAKHIAQAGRGGIESMCETGETGNNLKEIIKCRGLRVDPSRHSARMGLKKAEALVDR